MLHFAFLFPFNLRTHFSSASYLEGHLTQKHPINFSAKKDKTTKNTLDEIVIIVGNHNRCELLPLGNSFPSGSLKLGSQETIGSWRYPYNDDY